MSEAVRKSTTEAELLVPVSGFRLACQETMSRWKQFTAQEHEAHKQAFASRAILEVVYERLGRTSQRWCTLSKTYFRHAIADEQRQPSFAREDA